MRWRRRELEAMGKIDLKRAGTKYQLAKEDLPV